LWAILSGLGLGALILLALAGSLAAIWTFRRRFVGADGAVQRINPAAAPDPVNHHGEHPNSGVSQAALTWLSPIVDRVRSSRMRPFA
jgi:hypothetical protein